MLTGRATDNLSERIIRAVRRIMSSLGYGMGYYRQAGKAQSNEHILIRRPEERGDRSHGMGLDQERTGLLRSLEPPPLTPQTG